MELKETYKDNITSNTWFYYVFWGRLHEFTNQHQNEFWILRHCPRISLSQPYPENIRPCELSLRECTHRKIGSNGVVLAVSQFC